jgi:hypothetical protein
VRNLGEAINAAAINSAERTAVTDTPIYDQVRRELRERGEPERPAGRSREDGVSVWALIDQHRPGEGRRSRR